MHNVFLFLDFVGFTCPRCLTSAWGVLFASTNSTPWMIWRSWRPISQWKVYKMGVCRTQFHKGKNLVNDAATISRKNFYAELPPKNRETCCRHSRKVFVEVLLFQVILGDIQVPVVRFVVTGTASFQIFASLCGVCVCVCVDAVQLFLGLVPATINSGFLQSFVCDSLLCHFDLQCPQPFVCDTVARNTFIASTGRPWSAWSQPITTSVSAMNL